jgi:hypothetical protein
LVNKTNDGWECAFLVIDSEGAHEGLLRVRSANDARLATDDAPKPSTTSRPMIQQLVFSFVLAAVTVVMHAVGTVHVVIPASRVLSWKGQDPPMPRPVWTLTCLVSMLLALHFLEISIWAAAFTGAHVLPDFETSLYYSLKSYTTVGYGDVLPPLAWRLLGPMEAAIGVLMLGWSTAIIVAAVQRIYGFRSASSTTAP